MTYSTATKNLISVIIPCRNGTNYLAEAVAGINRQNMPVEIIVVDDHSTDETAELAESMGCRVIRHEVTRGQVAGKNTGLKAAKGEYVLFHDHDDVMAQGALAALYRELTSAPDTWLVMAKVQDFFSPELDEMAKRRVNIKAEPYYGLFTGAVLMRKNLFDYTGYFDEQLTAGEIITLMAKLKTLPWIKYKKIDVTTCNRRVHANNYGRTNADKEYKDYMKILRDNLRH